MATSIERPSSSQVASDITEATSCSVLTRLMKLWVQTKCSFRQEAAVLSKPEMLIRLKFQMNFCFKYCNFKYHCLNSLLVFVYIWLFMSISHCGFPKQRAFVPDKIKSNNLMYSEELSYRFCD